jgi:hypothetical protein
MDCKDEKRLVLSKGLRQRKGTFPNDLHLAVMHLQCAAKLLLDYNAKVQAWDLNEENSVTLADQLDNFWESIRPIREGVGMCMEEEEDDADLSFENFPAASLSPKN